MQTVQNYHKELPRLSGIIRVHSGRTERTSPITSERFSPQSPCRHISLRVRPQRGAQQAHKKLSPVSMRGNSQNGGQTTKSLLTKPQCSGVPIQQAVSLSSSFPRHCLLFVCAFSLKCQKAQGRRNCPCPRLLHTKPPRLPATETGAVRLLYGYFFQALAQNLARGLLVSPAYAGKSCRHQRRKYMPQDHPRVCGEKRWNMAATW